MDCPPYVQVYLALHISPRDTTKQLNSCLRGIRHGFLRYQPGVALPVLVSGGTKWTLAADSTYLYNRNQTVR